LADRRVNRQSKSRSNEKRMLSVYLRYKASHLKHWPLIFGDSEKYRSGLLRQNSASRQLDGKRSAMILARCRRRRWHAPDSFKQIVLRQPISRIRFLGSRHVQCSDSQRPHEGLNPANLTIDDKTQLGCRDRRFPGAIRLLDGRSWCRQLIITAECSIDESPGYRRPWNIGPF
jgi:hypothetical protein